MNIFYALSEGRGRLTETNFSAFLSFLLSPHGSHGFSDIFLRAFLSEIAIKCNEKNRFQTVLSNRYINAQVDLEVRYGNRTVDIDIQIFDREGEKIHQIVIENKINPYAANSEQLKDQFLCVNNVLRENEPCPITMVFLTPPGHSKLLFSEFSALEIDTTSKHKKAWIHWKKSHENSEQEKTIVDLIRHLLQLEASADIEPISDYSRHTLKAFIQFLERTIQSTNDKTRVASVNDESELIAQLEVNIEGKNYQICRYESGVVIVLNLELNQKVPAHPLLRKIIATYNLDIPLERGPGKPLNTQQLGQKVLEKLKTT